MHQTNIPDSGQPQWQQQIEELQAQGIKAFLAQDVDRLRPMWSDDLVVNSPLHRIHDKNQVLDLLQRGIIKHSSLEEHIEVIKRHGDCVIVMGHDVVINEPNTPPIHRRFTNIWRATGESWQLVARHAQPVPAS